MKDTVSLLIEPTPFDNEDARLGMVKDMVETLRAAPSMTLKPFAAHSQNIGYFVEYPLYTSFPELRITSERADLKDHAWTAFFTVNKEISTQFTENLAVSYACILIVPVKKGAFKGGDTQAVYDVAESIVNQYIRLYKLLPYIHHHDLSERNNTRSGVLAPVMRYELAPEVRSLESDGLLLNMGFANFWINQQDLSLQHHGLLFSGFHKNDWTEFHNSLYRLVRAYDFNCYGDADSAIIFATSSIEGFLMTMQHVIQVREMGMDYDASLRQVRERKLGQLVSSARKIYGLNTNKSDQRTVYGRWHNRCYKQRNDIIHRQSVHRPHVSRPAIDASAALVLHIARLVRRKYSRSSSLMGIIEAVAQGMLSKGQGESQLIARRLGQVAISAYHS